jgi:hypothetical protein
MSACGQNRTDPSQRTVSLFLGPGPLVRLARELSLGLYSSRNFVPQKAVSALLRIATANADSRNAAFRPYGFQFGFIAPHLPAEAAILW